MANFLETFKACIESFFTSKKAWIGSQAFPKTNDKVVLPQQTSGSYIPPEDGYLLFFAPTLGSIDISCRETNKEPFSRLAFSSNGDFNIGSYFLVKKGCLVIYSFNQFAPEFIWFIPKEGA